MYEITAFTLREYHCRFLLSLDVGDLAFAMEDTSLDSLRTTRIPVLLIAILDLNSDGSRVDHVSIYFWRPLCESHFLRKEN